MSGRLANWIPTNKVLTGTAFYGWGEDVISVVEHSFGIDLIDSAERLIVGVLALACMYAIADADKTPLLTDLYQGTP